MPRPFLLQHGVNIRCHAPGAQLVGRRAPVHGLRSAQQERLLPAAQPAARLLPACPKWAANVSQVHTMRGSWKEKKTDATETSRDSPHAGLKEMQSCNNKGRGEFLGACAACLVHGELLFCPQTDNHTEQGCGG